METRKEVKLTCKSDPSFLGVAVDKQSCDFDKSSMQD